MDFSIWKVIDNHYRKYLLLGAGLLVLIKHNWALSLSGDMNWFLDKLLLFYKTWTVGYLTPPSHFQNSSRQFSHHIQNIYWIISTSLKEYHINEICRPFLWTVMIIITWQKLIIPMICTKRIAFHMVPDNPLLARWWELTKFRWKNPKKTEGRKFD